MAVERDTRNEEYLERIYRFAPPILLFGSFLICLCAGGADPIVNNAPPAGGAVLNGDFCPLSPLLVWVKLNPPPADVWGKAWFTFPLTGDAG
jgi:hypothetical protein